MKNEVTLSKKASDITPEILNTQWDKAQSGLINIITFGAMMIEKELIISRGRKSSLGSHGGDRKNGTGLKTWLEENCPDINYKTAMGYKMAAMNLRKAAGLADDVPLLAAMDALNDEYDGVHASVMGILEGASLSLLKGGALAGKGLPVTALSAPKTVAEEEAELKVMAETTITDAVNLLTAYIDSEMWRTMSPTNVRHYANLLKDKVQVIAAAVR